jgi:hypothetical protein
VHKGWSCFNKIAYLHFFSAQIYSRGNESIIYARSENVVGGSVMKQLRTRAPYRIAMHIPNVLTIQKTQNSSTLTWLVDGRWEQYILLKTNSLYLDHSSALHHEAQELWIPRLLQMPHHRKCCTANADVVLTMQSLMSLTALHTWIVQYLPIIIFKILQAPVNCDLIQETSIFK